MKVLENLCLLYCPSVRAQLYLKALLDQEVIPGHIIVHGKNEHEQLLKGESSDFWQRYSEHFDASETFEELVQKHQLSVSYIEEKDVNSAALKAEIGKRTEEIYIFSGGGIVDGEHFSGEKTYLHTHPGALPLHRGSTCFYYAMLERSYVSASTFVMTPNLDDGKVLASRDFCIPKVPREDALFYDLIFDPWIRAQTLSAVISDLKLGGLKPGIEQGTSEQGHYHVIHPVLKRLALEPHFT